MILKWLEHEGLSCFGGSVIISDLSDGRKDEDLSFELQSSCGQSRYVARGGRTGPGKSPKPVHLEVERVSVCIIVHGGSFFLEGTIRLFKVELKRSISGEQRVLISAALCSPVQVKSKREENKSQLSSFCCQEEVLFDFYLHHECSLEKNMTFGNFHMSVDSPPTSFSVSIASLGTRALGSFPVNDEAQMLWINHSLVCVWGEISKY